MSSSSDLFSGLPLDPLPPGDLARRTEAAPHAPVRQHGLDGEGKKVPSCFLPFVSPLLNGRDIYCCPICITAFPPVFSSLYFFFRPKNGKRKWDAGKRGWA